MIAVAFYILTDHDETRVLHRFEAPTRLDEVDWPGTLSATPHREEPDSYRIRPLDLNSGIEAVRWWDARIEGRFKNHTAQVVARTFTVEGQDPWRELDDVEQLLRQADGCKTALAIIARYKEQTRR